MNEMNLSLLEQFMQLQGLFRRFFHQNHTHGQMKTAYSGQGRVLKFLKISSKTSQKELADILGLRPQSLGELLTKLEKNGYITRTPDENDKRVVTVKLTEKGRNEETGAETMKNADNAFNCLNGDEQQQLGIFLDRIITNLEEESASSQPCRNTGHHHWHAGGNFHGRMRKFRSETPHI